MKFHVIGALVGLALGLGTHARAEEPRGAAPDGSSAADTPRAALGFSKLLFRISDDEHIGVAKEDFAVFILEGLRERGFNAVGAENLVFDQDRSKEADFVLGGTVQELECLSRPGGVARTLNCRIAIEWQLLDARSQQVVYRGLTRGLVLGGSRNNTVAIGKGLVLSALHSLTQRPRFSEFLTAPKRATASAKPGYDTAYFRRCEAGERKMPVAAEEVLPATAVVHAGSGFGSGFFLNGDGLLLTAAHVVRSSSIEVRLKDGSTYPATVVRSSEFLDTALLRVDGLRGRSSCLALAPGMQPLGSELYAIGAPASESLAFSITRGIVSGVREIEGQKLLQTDASVNPGNSGGPLVDGEGRATAIVSFKLTGSAIQGLAFGIPADVALQSLGLAIGTETDRSLFEAAAPVASAPASDRVFVDGADGVPSIDPEGDRQRAAEARERRRDELRDERRPAFVSAMRWGGLGLGVVGALGVPYTFFKYEKGSTSHAEYNSLTTWNNLAWVAAGTGLSAFALSFVLEPSVDDADLEPKTSVAVSGSDVRVRVQF